MKYIEKDRLLGFFLAWYAILLRYTFLKSYKVLHHEVEKYERGEAKNDRWHQGQISANQ